MRIILTLITCITLMFVVTNITYAETQTWSASMQVEQDKEWKITFSKPVGSLVGHVYLYNHNGQSLDYSYLLSEGDTVVTIKPKNRYELGEQYKLVVKPTLKSKDGQKITNGIEKTFVIEDGEKNSFVFQDDIIISKNWKFVSESDEYGYTVYRFEVPEGQIYGMLEPVYIESFGNYERGLIGQTFGYDIRQDEENDPVVIRIIEPDILDVMDEFVLKEAMPVKLESVTLADNKGYTVASLKGPYAKSENGYEIMFYDFTFDYKGKTYKVKGDMKLTDFDINPNINLKKVRKKKDLGLTISGNVRHNLTFEAGKQETTYKPGLIDIEHITPEKTKDFVEGQVRLPAFPAVGAEIGLEFFLEAALAGGVRIVNVDDYNFELGFFYDNDGDLHYVNDLNRIKYTPTLSGFGEAKVYAGIKGYTNLFLAELDLIQLFSKFGPYADIGVYTTADSFFQSDNVCYSAELGYKYEYGLKLLPQFDLNLEVKNSSSLKSQSDTKSCNFVKGIKPVNDTISVKAGETIQPDIEANILDVQKGTTKYKALTRKQKKNVTYSVDSNYSQYVTITKDGVKVSKNAPATKVPVQVYYKDENDRNLNTVVNLSITPDITPEKIIESAQKDFIKKLSKDVKYKKVAFKDVNNPHIVTLTPVYDSWRGYDFESEKILKVHEYNPSTDKWSTVYTHEFYPIHYMENTYINLYGDKREQLFVTVIQGSGGFLDTTLIGSNSKGKITQLFDISSIMNGALQINKQSFKICQNDVDYDTKKVTSTSKTYKWNGSKITSTSGGACKY